jgi:hypothetical protein
MNHRSVQRPLMLAVVLALAAPVGAAPVARPESRASCPSAEGERFVGRGRPLPPDVEPSSLEGRTTYAADDVVRALREGKAVELQHVRVTGTLDLGKAALTLREAELPFRRGHGRRLLDDWLVERRREHRALDELPGDAEFRVVCMPLSITDSWIDSVEGGAGSPLFFTEAVDLRGTRIAGALSLPGAIFREAVDLERLVISRWASFAGAHFDAGLDLSRARFAGSAAFDGATFGARALSRRRSRDGRSLAETPAAFTAAAFAGPVSFRDAHFQSRADFQKATFAKDAEFSATRFQQRADFGQARFAERLDASHAIFETEARFPNATFDKPASFRRADFRWRADFGLATFSDPASTFRDARFGPSLGQLLLGSSTSARRWVEATGYDFHQTTFGDKSRTLARSEFDIHGIFGVTTCLAAAVGLGLCWALRRRPLLHWRPAPAGGQAVAEIRDAVRADDASAGTLARMRAALARALSSARASPREQLGDAAFMLIAYAALVVGLAVHYQVNAGSSVDLAIGLVNPLILLIAWGAAFAASRVVLGFRARQRLASPRPPKSTPPRLDYFEPEYHVARPCDELVRAFARRVSTGVLGLAGLPGAGRSWLARAVVEGRLAPGSPADSILAVRAWSPASGDLFPFFTILFRRVAEETRHTLRRSLFTGAGESRYASAAEELIELPPAVALVPLGVVLAAIAAILTFPWRPPVHGNPFDWTPATVARVFADFTPIMLLSTLALLAGTYCLRLWRRKNLRKALQTTQTGRLYMATERVLERLAFEESTSDERGGSIAVHGVGLQRRRLRALKERPVTLPVILADFQSYVEELRTVYPGGVVVHIDDADRNDDLASVRELLLRLKATLVGGVLYLVPLPDRVLEGQRLRVKGPAGVVAALLDDVIVVPPMSVLEGLRMLAHREFFASSRSGLGLAICIVSGGIPKEILRLLRRVSTEGDDWTVERLMERTWQDARDGVSDAIRRSDLRPALKQPILSRLDSLSSRSEDDEGWLQWQARANSLARSARAADTPPRLAVLEAQSYLAERRWAIGELRKKMATLGTWEQELLDSKGFRGEEPWDTAQTAELEKIRGAFLATVGAAGAPA